MGHLAVWVSLLHVSMMLMVLAPRKLIALLTLCLLVIRMVRLTVNLLLQSA